MGLEFWKWRPYKVRSLVSNSIYAVHFPLPLSILHSTTTTAITLTIQICNKVVLFIGQWDGVIRGQIRKEPTAPMEYRYSSTVLSSMM